MDEKQERYEIDLLQILRDLLKRWHIIAISGILCAIITLGYTFYFITPKYSAGIMLYVNSASSAGSLDIGDVTTARSLVETYCIILTSRSTLERVVTEAQLNCEYTELESMLSAQILNETEVFSISVTHEDPYIATEIANTIARVLPEEVAKIVENSSLKIVDEASVPTSPVSPSYKRNIAIGLLLGLILGVAGVLIYEFLNNEVKSEEWIERNYGEEIPLLAVIPDLNDDIGHHYGSYGYYKTSVRLKS